MSRWVKIPADIFNCPFFSGEPFGTREAFVWLSQVWDKDPSRFGMVTRVFGWRAPKVWRFVTGLIKSKLLCGPVFDDLALFYKKKSPRPHIPNKVRKAVMKRDGNFCRYCGSSEGPFHLDHIKPWSKGGDDIVSNLTVACRACNSSKRDMTPEEWRR